MNTVRVGGKEGRVVVKRPTLEDKLARKFGNAIARDIVRDAHERARDDRHYRYLICVALAAKECP